MSNLYVTQTVNGDLQPVKVNGESSALEIAQDEVKVKSLEVDGISRVPTPTSNEHIANKAYVDSSGGGISNVVEDTSPQLGGDLDLNGNNLDFPTTANISDCLDEDNMSSNSATKICTQQSIKAYVDSQAHYTGVAYSSTVIKVYPTAFCVNDDYARTPNMIEDDTTDTLGFRVGHSNEEAYAFVPIPAGYSATHVQVHASASTSLAANCRSYNYQTGATVNLEAFALNTNQDITDVNGDSLDLVIKYMGVSAATIVYGATVTIAAN